MSNSESPKPGHLYLVVQQGGASTEMYLHAFDTYEQARNYRRSCDRASYASSRPIRVSEALAEHLGVIEGVLDAAMDLV